MGWEWVTVGSRRMKRGYRWGISAGSGIELEPERTVVRRRAEGHVGELEYPWPPVFQSGSSSAQVPHSTQPSPPWPSVRHLTPSIHSPNSPLFLHPFHHIFLPFSPFFSHIFPINHEKTQKIVCVPIASIVNTFPFISSSSNVSR